MEKHRITAKWLGKTAFESEIAGHKIITDTGPEAGGEDKGYRPKQLMLMALAGCTGIDVALITKKMRLDIDDMNIIVEGDLTSENPKHYESMHVIFEFTGKDLPLDKLQQAVDLSKDKYCGVMASYKKAMKVTTEIRVVMTLR